jgi:1-acyl-sn-glycerol-3-phosphate acyltransferase
MIKVLIEKPYKFVPPYSLAWPPRLLTKLGCFGGVLRKSYGVVGHECRNVERLRKSIQAGHGVMLTPNHPRMSDPIAMMHIAQEAPCLLYSMASWHLFNSGWFTRFMVRLMGGFSVNREGLDRAAVDYAIKILQSADRPLLIFPEGATSRTNDQLMVLMEGPAFIARTAAKRRAKENGGKVVVHPVAIKYLYQGDVEQACNPVLTEIERKLTWRPDPSLPLIDRIVKVGKALMTLKELQYGVVPNPGQALRERQSALVNVLLHPLEEEWLGSTSDGGIASRIKNLRMKIFPEISRAQVDAEERDRRWLQLEDTYLAQQIDCYPGHYITALPSVDRILETVEKFEEDLESTCRVHGQMKVVLDVCEPIEVSPERDRKAKTDPLMLEIQLKLEECLQQLQYESRLYNG